MGVGVPRGQPPIISLMRSPSKLLALSLALAATFATHPARAQEAGGRVVLVLPFDNRSGNASLNWIGNSFPDTLDKRLNSAGFLTISHDDRVFAFDHLGLPEDFNPSRATTIRIAQLLDANFVIVGSFTVSGATGTSAGHINIQAQVLDINALKLSAPLQDGAELSRLYDAENAVAWKIARNLDPQFNVSEQTFIAASGAVALPAFEDYIRGITAPTAAERIQRLQSAINLAPSYAGALLALGKEQYAARDYTAAATTLAKVPTGDRLALEANFYLGLSRFNNADYSGAEQAFAFIAARLPLPEVINNEAVALSRQNKDGAALFRQATAADPSAEDYHYNLAIALYRRGDTANALKEADAALKLKPNDNEAGALRARVSLAAPGTRLAANPDSGFSPVERIRRDYSEAAFRQATFQLNQVLGARLEMLPADQRASQYTALGHDNLNQGLLPEAESEFQSALTANPNSAEAHAGLAQVRERSGNPSGARDEALTSLRLKPTAEGFLVLARLDLAENLLAASADDVAHALRLEPRNSAAIAMKVKLQQRGQQIP
jgi:Tfp pilus assembly protein PilF